ncbi:MAG: dTDP-4-dehydrorhamnose reductase [Nanoarchaeota archaeon]|nr:dTDP-4-dehydrorhamnose reductase [Nanoarchaeota archaeon]MBU1703830.1 dTDP-4-dehydrorhamnose reductase [Nanoarchaeota archaeon]
METIKITIMGAGGFLGTKLVKILSEHHEVYPFYHGKEPKVDITQIQDIQKIIDVKPNIVIHAAGMTNVDLCETYKELAEKVNVAPMHSIVEACNKTKAKLVYFSTDFIFDGEKGMYKEDDTPNPLGYYALTKLKAENILKEKSDDYLILRVVVLYGYNGDNSERSYVNWVVNSLSQGKEIKTYTDQYGTPTLTDDIADAVNLLTKNDCKGVYHVAGAQRLTRYDMAIKIAEEFNLNKCLIKPILMKDLNLPAKRPKDSSLSIEKLKKQGILMHTFEEGIKIMRHQTK